MVKDNVTTTRLRIDTADIIIDDFGGGRGKIIISDYEWGSYSYYWGHMGEPIKDFLQRIGTSYFCGKLLHQSDINQFDAKKSIQNVRRYIREELKYELPFYKFMSGQKELRERLREIENESYNSDEFIRAMSTISEDVYCYELDRADEREFKSILKTLEEEPWCFIATSESRTYKWMEQLYGKLKKELKSE